MTAYNCSRPPYYILVTYGTQLQQDEKAASVFTYLLYFFFYLKQSLGKCCFFLRNIFYRINNAEPTPPTLVGSLKGYYTIIVNKIDVLY